MRSVKNLPWCSGSVRSACCPHTAVSRRWPGTWCLVLRSTYGLLAMWWLTHLSWYGAGPHLVQEAAGNPNWQLGAGVKERSPCNPNQEFWARIRRKLGMCQSGGS